MSRARLLIFNAALGPLDYRVPEGMEVEPGSVVVAPLGPRQIVGVVWEAERLPRTPRWAKAAPAARRSGAAARRAAAAADRMDRRLLLRLARLGARMVLASGGAARAGDDDRVPADRRRVPERMTPQRARRSKRSKASRRRSASWRGSPGSAKACCAACASRACSSRSRSIATGPIRRAGPGLRPARADRRAGAGANGW